MMQKLRGNKEGFTLIELMIVIAIIGILAAIAIPNFIAYRNKAFCSAAESDAHAVAAEIANYFAVPTRVNIPTLADLDVEMSNLNSLSLGTDIDNLTISVTEGASRCPQEYRDAIDGWSGYVFTLNMN